MPEHFTIVKDMPQQFYDFLVETLLKLETKSETGESGISAQKQRKIHQTEIGFEYYSIF